MSIQEFTPQMKNKVIIDYNPLNFNLDSVITFSLVLLLFLLGLIVAIAMNGSINWLHKGVLAFLLPFLILILIFTGSWKRRKIYIYHVSFANSKIHIKWQELKKMKKAIIELDDIHLKIIPWGKNTPYLQISFKYKDKEYKLKQFYHNGWDKVVMQSLITDIEALRVSR